MKQASAAMLLATAAAIMGCRSATLTIKFEPAKYAYSALDAITDRAIELGPDDVPAMEACKLERIGHVRCAPTCEAHHNQGTYQYYGNFQEYAASYGATHILLVGSRWTPTGSETSLQGYSTPYGLHTASTRTRETGHSTETYRLFRVANKQQWSCLPEELRPGDIEWEPVRQP